MPFKEKDGSKNLKKALKKKISFTLSHQILYPIQQL